jgi:hypothetical protein
MAGVTIEMSADESRAWTAIQRLARGTGELEQGLKKVAETNKDAADAAGKLENAAKRIYTETRTPQEQFLAKQAQCSELLKAGKIDAETYGRAVGQAQERARQATEGTAGALEKAGHARVGAFGAQAIGQLKEFAIGLVGVGTAAAAALKFLDMMAERKKEAAKTVQESESPMKALEIQVRAAGGDSTKAVESARKFAASAGIDENQAAGIRAEMISAGTKPADQRFFEELAGTAGVPNVGGVVRASAAYSEANKGKAGSQRAIVSQAAATGVPTDQYEALLTAGAKTASAARNAGFSPTENLAATGTVMRQRGARAAQGMQRLYQTITAMRGGGEMPSDMSDEGRAALARIGVGVDLTGLTPVQMVERLGQLTPPERLAVDSTGALEALIVATPQNAETLDRVKKADPEGAALVKESDDPQIQAARGKRVADAALKMFNAEQTGTRTTLAQSILAHRMARRGLFGGVATRINYATQSQQSVLHGYVVDVESAPEGTFSEKEVATARQSAKYLARDDPSRFQPSVDKLTEASVRMKVAADAIIDNNRPEPSLGVPANADK